MMGLQKEINEKIMKERNAILQNGGKLKGKQGKIVNAVLSEYDLSDYEVSNPMPFFIQLKEVGTHQKMIEKASENAQIERKRNNFKKRVKTGQIEKSISNWIEKYHVEYEVRHSRSIVNSESFYIFEKGSEIALIKLSLHNTIAQEMEYGTPFIDLNGYTSVIDLKKDIERRLEDVAR